MESCFFSSACVKYLMYEGPLLFKLDTLEATFEREPKRKSIPFFVFCWEASIISLPGLS
jgi:hypothetical protein